MVNLAKLDSVNLCAECGANLPRHQPDCQSVKGEIVTYTSEERPEIDLVRQLTDIRDTARTGLPADGMTEEQWAKHRLNVIAGDLTRLIVWA